MSVMHIHTDKMINEGHLLLSLIASSVILLFVTNFILITSNYFYGTNHPQLKRHMRVTRMCAACAKAKNMRGIKPLVYTRVHASTCV